MFRSISLWMGYAIAIVAFVMGAVVVDGLHDDVAPSDVGVVLGSKVLADGTPSNALRARLDRAGTLYHDGMFGHIIVSGGTGKEEFSEAQVMADYLTLHAAVPREAILLDEGGYNTRATAAHSADIMQAHGFRSATVVSQYFHVTRSRLALESAGVPEVHGAHAYFWDSRDAYSLPREIVALPVYWWSTFKT